MPPRSADGSVSRSLTSDVQKDAAGLVTAAQLAEHTALRRGVWQAARPLERGPLPPGNDPWALLLPVLTGGDLA